MAVITGLLLLITASALAVNTNMWLLPETGGGYSSATATTNAVAKTNSSKVTSNVSPKIGVSSNPVFLIRLYGIDLPPTNTVEFSGDAETVVTNIHTGLMPTNDWHLYTSDFIQGPTLTNHSKWFVLDIQTVNTNYFFSPNDLRFSESSSATSDLFSNSFSYGTNSFVYTKQAAGYLIGPSGPSSDTVITTGLWTNKVNRFIFVGHQSIYFICNNSAQSNSVDGYLNSAAVNFRITGTFSINDGVNSASASLSVYRQTGPSSPVLNIGTSVNQTENVGLTSISQYDTWIIQATPSLQTTTWSDIATVSGGLNNFNWTNGPNPMKFFRAKLQ